MHVVSSPRVEQRRRWLLGDESVEAGSLSAHATVSCLVDDPACIRSFGQRWVLRSPRKHGTMPAPSREAPALGRVEPKGRNLRQWSHGNAGACDGEGTYLATFLTKCRIRVRGVPSPLTGQLRGVCGASLLS